MFVFNSHVQLPALRPLVPTPILWFYYIFRRGMRILLLLLPKRVRISAVENYCSCLAFRNVGAETRLRCRRRLPLPWSRRSKSALQSHSTLHSNALFICVHPLPRSSLRAKVAVVYFVKLVHSSCSIIIYGKGE